MREPALTLALEDEATTGAAGRWLAQSIPVGSKELLLTLRGELGAGKTCLARAILRALGAAGPVKSPTYTLVEPYELPPGRVLHLDLYRLAGPEELEWLGYRDLREGSLLTLVEWPERAPGALGQADLEAELDYLGTGRQLRLRPGGAPGRAWLDAFRRCANIPVQGDSVN